MRGFEKWYGCMFCGFESDSHDVMLDHFRVEHKEHWTFIKKPSELEEECWRE